MNSIKNKKLLVLFSLSFNCIKSKRERIWDIGKYKGGNSASKFGAIAKVKLYQAMHEQGNMFVNLKSDLDIKRNIKLKEY